MKCKKAAEEESKDRMFKTYLTENIRLLCKNIAERFGGSVIEKTFNDFMESLEKSSDNEKSAQDIVQNVVQSAGLEVRQ